MKRCQKVSLIQYKCCIETRFSKCSSQQFAGFTVIVWLIQLSEYLTLPLNASLKSLVGKFFLLCCSYQANISQVIRSFFSYVRNSLHSCIYVSLAPFICLSIYFKIVDRKFVFQCVVVVNLMVARKREVSLKPNLCLWGAWKFPQKICAQRKSETNYLYISESLQKICCSFFKALLIMNVFSLTIHNSTYSKNNHNNQCFIPIFT